LDVVATSATLRLLWPSAAAAIAFVIAVYGYAVYATRFADFNTVYGPIVAVFLFLLRFTCSGRSSCSVRRRQLRGRAGLAAPSRVQPPQGSPTAVHPCEPGRPSWWDGWAVDILGARGPMA
jgi:hypothetical protein